VLAQWFKGNGDAVQKDEPLFVIETDKITLEIVAEENGVLSVTVPEGETVLIGSIVGIIDTEAAPEAPPEPEKKVEPAVPPPVEAPPPPPVTPPPIEAAEVPKPPDVGIQPVIAPSVRRLVAEKGLDVSKITGTGPSGRVTKGDVILYMESSTVPAPVAPPSVPSPPPLPISAEEMITRKPMSPIRQRIAQRLLEAKQNTAMLTTFNEIDMSRVQTMRKRFREPFEKKYGVRLGIMSFFIKASVEALTEFPAINAFIVDAKEVEYHDYCHIGVAIGAERGLVVPVIRHAERLGFAELEQAILDYVKKIKENRLELSDLEGGTFTITNGGVFGSLLSTPILNTPQSGILGMHKVEDRPMVIDGEIQIRPMMYVALSYDHRIVDGREAVTFLRRIKECVEEPERMMIDI
jgi:2-oxoglutarate dehydrogenase E2 component (dihydrolipoamide succinyltransferase)